MIGLLAKSERLRRKVRASQFLWNKKGEAHPPVRDLWRMSLEPLIDQYLQGIDGQHEIGRLKPDILVRNEGEAVAVIDAKYKLLANSRERPSGVDPADLYQIVAYAMRFKPANGAALVYPEADAADRRASPSHAESYGPWLTGGRTITFMQTPTDVRGCCDTLMAGGLVTEA